MMMVARKLALAAAQVIVGVVLVGVLPVFAQSPDQKALEEQIGNALKSQTPQAGGLTRGLVAVPQPDAKTLDQQKFINSLRTRSIAVEPAAPGKADGPPPVMPIAPEERARIADIASSKPQIDLEIYFDYKSSVVGPKALPALVALGNVLTRNEFADTIFLINGYTDARGSSEYNLQLSQQRAAAVRRVLIEQFHLPPDVLIAVGFGKENLKFPGQPFADQNRRVQIVNTEIKATATVRQ
jgi:outer membrane protein OmpA-like peptidoglycan-associated protein